MATWKNIIITTEHIYKHMYILMFNYLDIYVYFKYSRWKPKLQDEDAGLTGQRRFSTGKKSTVGRISEQCDEHGLAELVHHSKLAEALFIWPTNVCTGTSSVLFIMLSVFYSK